MVANTANTNCPVTTHPTNAAAPSFGASRMLPVKYTVPNTPPANQIHQGTLAAVWAAGSGLWTMTSNAAV